MSINLFGVNKANINILIVCSTFLTPLQLSYAQKSIPYFRHISIEQGLQIRSVQDFLFDSAHTSWIAAANKLIKYDGHSFEKFGTDLLLNQTILRVIPGAENVYWLLLQNTNLENSLLIFNLEDSTFIPYDYLVSNQNYPVIHAPTEFYKSPHGLGFLTTQSGEIYKFENESIRKVFQLDTEMGIYDFVGLENSFWLTTDEEIIKLDLDFNIESRIKTEKQVCLVPIDKNVWVYKAGKGFYPINASPDADSKLKILPLPREIQGLTEKPLNSKDFYWHQSSRSLWISFDGLLFNWDWDTGEVKDFSSILTNFPLINTINSISEDHNRQIWFGTSDGILIYNPVKFDFESFFTLEQTKKQLSLRGIALRENSMYVNSYLGLLHYDFEKENYFLQDSITTGHLVSLKFDTNGKLLQGTSRTLRKIDLKMGIEDAYFFDSYNSLNQSNWDIWEIYQDNSGKIWLGTEEGLAYLDEKTKKIKLIPASKGQKDNLPKRVYHIYKSENQFWLSTLTGLFLYDPIDGWVDLEKEYEYLDQLQNIPIVHLHKDKEGIFWLATDGNGLIKWDKEKSKIQFFNTQSGLANNHIHAIYEDSANGLWLASNGGIMRFDKETFSVQHFTLDNGLPHIEFNRASHTQDSLGNLYFGGVAGMVKFNPENFLKLYKDYSGELIAKNIKFLSKTSGRLESNLYNAVASIEIPPDYSGFELEMHLQDYMDGHIYAYTVDDYEDGWIYQTNPKILIAGLAPGKHKIVIKAQNKFGQWLDQRTLYFRVIPPFYQTLWFWLIVAFICSGVGFLFYKEKTRRIKKLNLKLEEEVKERTQKIESDKILLEKQAKKLEEQERQKAAFYANISHDLRTPMTLIKGPFEHILQRSEDQEISNLAQMGIQHTEITLKLIDQLIELSRKEQLEEQVAFKTLDLAAYLKGLTLSFESLAETQHIGLSFWSDPEKILIESDPDLLEKIIYNLLSNAFKYTPNGGYIEVGIKLEGNTCDIIVKDSGVGISQKDLPFIFDRYFQTEASKAKPQGVGLGLSIVKELVKRLDGEITVESQLNQGTAFHINLPVRDNQSGHDSQADRLQTEHDLTLGSEDFLTDTFENEEEPVENTGKIILIVDDIPAIRQYIRYNLGRDFRIFDADNGQEGLELARTHVPDLIICDVKMPLMDGYSFCKLIKEDVAVSHIPVILLTAMADMENKIKGLDAGAEDYLYKPFNSKELLLKVQNLLQHQEKLAAYYSKSLVSPSASSSVFQLKPKEQHFLDDVTANIQFHLDDENFSVVELSDLMCMSRKNLHRKIKALTDQSPSLLIRSIRLSEAMKILKEGKYNISEVAFMVGFNSPAYFSKCFQEMYGVAPKEV